MSNFDQDEIILYYSISHGKTNLFRLVTTYINSKLLIGNKSRL